MDEYIDRENYCKNICRCAWDKCNKDKCPIWTAPAADVAPVAHGKWEYEPETANTYGVLKCSKCGWWTIDPSIDGAYHYCPHCGAKMDLEE